MPGTVPGCVEGQGEIPRISKALLSFPGRPQAPCRRPRSSKDGSQPWLAVRGAVLDTRNRAICAKPLCSCLSSPRRSYAVGILTVQARGVCDLPAMSVHTAVRVQLGHDFFGRTSPRITPLPLIGQELALVGDPDAVALRMLYPLQIHPEVNGAHDAIAELLVDQRLYGGAVDLRNLVNPVDGGVHRNVGVERSAHGDLLQRRCDLRSQPEHVAGHLRLFGAHWVLPKQGGSGPYLGPPDLLCELRKGEPLLALRFED